MKIIKSILYVEDEKNTLDNLSKILKRFCHNLYLAGDGEEGFNLYKKYTPSVVITDIKMPIMDGIVLANKIKELNEDVKIIFLTSFSKMSLLQKAIEVHAEGYLLKPLDLDSLEQMLKKINKSTMLEEEIKEKRINEIKQKQELETILSTTKDGISILDLDTNFLYANNAFLQMLGYSLEELKKLSSIELSVEEDKENAYKVLKEVLKNGYKENYLKSYIRKDSKKIYVRISGTIMPDRKRILISTKDITSEISTQQKLDKYLNIINENIITSSADLNRKIIKVSDAFCKISGYKREELIGRKHSILRHPDTSYSLYDDIYENLNINGIWEGEIKNKKANGEEYYINTKIYLTFDENGEKSGYTSISQDITYLKKVKELSIKDGLTNIYNRRFFNEIFPNYIKSAKRENELISFMMVDVDYFKKYNDTYGHQKGDEALIQIAKILSESFKRGDDYIFRLGGEEFGGLYKVKDCRQSLNFLKSICKKVKDLNIVHKHGIDSCLSVSIGLVCIEAKEITDERVLYKKVDNLLYEAKEDGRNRVKSNFIEG